MKFTDKALTHLPRKQSIYTLRDSYTPGLTIRVMPKGTVTFYYERVIACKKIRTNIGRYPQISLDIARRSVAAQKVTDYAIGSETPSKAAHDMKDLVRLWLRGPVKKLSPSSQTLYASMCDITLEHWTTSEDITPQNARAVFKSLASTPVKANRWKAATSSFCTYLLDEAIIEYNPTLGIKKHPETAKDRNMTENEMAKLAGAMNVSDINPDIKLAIKLMLATGCRVSEACGMQLSELDLEEGTWLLPKERSKNKRAHVMYLPDALIAALKEHKPTSAHKGFLGKLVDPQSVFHGIATKGQMTDGSVRQALSRLCIQALILDNVCPHDLRRTAGTLLAKLGTPLEVRKAFLNHAPTGVTDVHYNLYQYWPERKEAAKKIESVLTKAGIL